MKKLFISLPLILCLITSCQDKTSKAELEKLKTQLELEDQNKEMLRQYYAELDNTKIDSLDKFVDKYISTNFIIHFPGGIDIEGKNGLLEYYTTSMKAFSDGAHIIDDVIAEKDKVAFRATAKSKHTGEFNGIQPSDKEIQVTFDGFWLIQDGKVIEWWSEYDALGMMTQLGMELKMKEENK